MGEVIEGKKGERAELKKFGLTLGIAFGLLGGLSLWRGHVFRGGFLTLFSLVCFLGILQPLRLKPLYKAWMWISAFLGAVMTRVILTLLFYLVVTPLGLLARVFRQKLLERRFDRDASSYWVAVKGRKTNADYERQF